MSVGCFEELSEKLAALLLGLEAVEKEKNELYDALCLDKDAKEGVYTRGFIDKKVKYIEISDRWVRLCQRRHDLEKAYYDYLLGAR